MSEERDYAAQRYRTDGLPTDWDDDWAAKQVRNIIARNSADFSQPVSIATLIPLARTVFKTGGRLDSVKDVLFVIDDAVKNALTNGKMVEITSALTKGWELSDYVRATAYDLAVYKQAREDRIHLDSPEEFSAVIDFLGTNGNWVLNPQGRQKANAQYKENYDAQERQRFTSELTGDGKHGFSVIIPVGNPQQGWTTKKISYDAQGRELRPDLQGFSKSGWMPRKGDEGFAAMTTERIKELAEAVRTQNNLHSQSVEGLRKTTKDLRVGIPATFGAEMVAQQAKTNDDALFMGESGYELSRAEMYLLAKDKVPGGLDRFRALIKRDANRVNRILGAK